MADLQLTKKEAKKLAYDAKRKAKKDANRAARAGGESASQPVPTVVVPSSPQKVGFGDYVVQLARAVRNQRMLVPNAIAILCRMQFDDRAVGSAAHRSTPTRHFAVVCDSGANNLWR
jgi:hypothetical protein